MIKPYVLQIPILVLSFLLLSNCTKSIPDLPKTFSDQIRLNQIGYYPSAVKKAVIVNADEYQEFNVIDSKNMEVVLKGTLSETLHWELAGEKVRIADFSEVHKEGEYYVLVPEVGYSYPFEIKKKVLHDVFLGSVKGMYYQRMGIPLLAEHAGKWHRKMAHPDDSVPFHPSSGRSKGFLNSPGGWYDAGDYNKYVVNGSFPLGQFYVLQEQYPNSIGDKDLNIPESGNGKSDYLDELKYEMDWLLTMQDDDGGSFHKVTAKKFDGMVMPNEATSQRYVVGKGTAATLDFAACAAKANRVFKSMDPDYAEKCLVAAKKAYAWALKNPNIAFVNPEDISTGQYGDSNFEDEWFWANAELFVTTHEATYLDQLRKKPIDFKLKPGDGWTRFMRYLGMISIMDDADPSAAELSSELKNGLLQLADSLVEKAKNLDYFQPVDDFQWGSNSDVLNAAMVMAQAYRIESKPKYLVGVQQAMDYILGTNAVGYSFVTGFGDKTPMFIHHRQSAADGIEAPVPGLLSGGPNSRLQDVVDGTVYPDDPSPMQSWVDQESSYASNEICLNWNAPLTYVLGFLEQESN
ncbi:MAG: glycoside hydrolase family 9 protein [Maribacter sp.]|uniref:glycoside hydrolase family 9 protein n=1 Tax=Maribacter sp. TaxID=1897614 RepID=UPI003C73CDAA